MRFIMYLITKEVVFTYTRIHNRLSRNIACRPTFYTIQAVIRDFVHDVESCSILILMCVIKNIIYLFSCRRVVALCYILGLERFILQNSKLADGLDGKIQPMPYLDTTQFIIDMCIFVVKYKYMRIVYCIYIIVCVKYYVIDFNSSQNGRDSFNGRHSKTSTNIFVGSIDPRRSLTGYTRGLS